MQHASAYEWQGRIFLHPDSKTTAGLWIGSKPISSLDPSDPVELGRAVLAALADSKERVPDPSIWENLSTPLLKLAGAKSFSAFFRSARYVSIELQNGRVTFSPWRNLGSRHGYRPINGKDRTNPANDPELGSSLISALQDTE
jgi:hypothetical protein